MKDHRNHSLPPWDCCMLALSKKLNRSNGAGHFGCIGNRYIPGQSSGHSGRLSPCRDRYQQHFPALPSLIVAPTPVLAYTQGITFACKGSTDPVSTTWCLYRGNGDRPDKRPQVTSCSMSRYITDRFSAVLANAHTNIFISTQARSDVPLLTPANGKQAPLFQTLTSSWGQPFTNKQPALL